MCKSSCSSETGPSCTSEKDPRQRQNCRIYHRSPIPNEPLCVHVQQSPQTEIEAGCSKKQKKCERKILECRIKCLKWKLREAEDKRQRPRCNDKPEGVYANGVGCGKSDRVRTEKRSDISGCQGIKTNTRSDCKERPTCGDISEAPVCARPCGTESHVGSRYGQTASGVHLRISTD